MDEACDLQVLVNGRHTLLLHQRVVCGFSGKLRAMVATKKKPGQEAESAAAGALLLSIELAGFPGGGEALELAARFCYGNGDPPPLLWRPATLPPLYCAAVFLEMTEEARPGNLLALAEAFADDGRRLWTWADALAAVRSCEKLLVPDSGSAIADALLEKLVSALFSKITFNRTTNCSSFSSSSPLSMSSSSSSSSPDTKTPPPEPVTTTKPCSSGGGGNEWWFDDAAFLSPPTVEKAMRLLGCPGAENNDKDPTMTRFLLHYLRRRRLPPNSNTLSALADTAAHGVAALAASGTSGCFSSCRSLFRVLRTVTAAGASRESRTNLETLLGSLLDQATLDDLLVPVSGAVPGGGVYDVSLVVRLVRVFVTSSVAMESSPEEEGMRRRLRKVGRLVDKYLGEISPDQGLTVGRFLAVAESLPDSARGCFDGVYRALDIFLQSHAGLTAEERATACRCVNYGKLTLEACRDLAKNRRVPAAVAVEALASQRRPDKLRNVYPPSTTPIPVDEEEKDVQRPRPSLWRVPLQSRVAGELMETAACCEEMTRGRRRTSKLQGRKSFGGRGLPRMC